MAFLTYRDLLAVDECHVQSESLYLFPSFADVSDMVHFHVSLIATDGAVVQQSGFGFS